jgi:hypothetical protein
MNKTMKMACVSALWACACLGAHAEPSNKAVATETSAAKEARLEREAVAQKQTEIFERKNIPLANDTAPAMLLDAPVDERDSPGATKK